MNHDIAAAQRVLSLVDWVGLGVGAIPDADVEVIGSCPGLTFGTIAKGLLPS